MVVMVVMVLMVDPDKSRWTLVKILEEREEKGEAGQKDKAEIVKIRNNLHLNNSHVKLQTCLEITCLKARPLWGLIFASDA